MSLPLLYFISYNMVVFPLKNNPNNLDPSYKIDLHLWDVFAWGNPIFKAGNHVVLMIGFTEFVQLFEQNMQESKLYFH